VFFLKKKKKDRMGSESFLIAAGVGFVVFWILGARRAGQEPKLGANILLYRPSGHCFHIHHWMLFAALGVVALLARKADPRAAMMAAGFAVGASLEDLRYPDWDVSDEACPKK
jgi:hypothetical protein